MLRVIRIYPQPAVVIISSWIREDTRYDTLELSVPEPAVYEHAVGVADNDDLVAVGVQRSEELFHSCNRRYTDDNILDLARIHRVGMQEFENSAHVDYPAARLPQILYVLGYYLFHQQFLHYYVGVVVADGVIEIDRHEHAATHLYIN